MRARPAPRAVRLWGIVALVPLLGGCPIPLPAHYDADSRRNLPAEPLDWIEEGVTTREEVLMRLGEADTEAADGSWLAYGSTYSRGGVIFVVAAQGGAGGAGGEKMEYHRLIVWFDGQGLVIRSEFLTRECWAGVIAGTGSGSRSPPCLPMPADARRD